MKKSLFLYLFIVAVLINVFTYAYFSKQHESDIATTQTKLKKANDSVVVLYNKLDDANYFSLEQNLHVQEKLNTDAQTFGKAVTNKILDMNDNPKGNELVPYDKMNDQKFIINKVKVLNHRWVIADFTDGRFWGEVLIKYFVEEDGSFTFERIDSQLYTE